MSTYKKAASKICDKSPRETVATKGYIKTSPQTAASNTSSKNPWQLLKVKATANTQS